MNDTKSNNGNNKPMTTEEDVQKNPDNKIDEDFPGFPHSPSKDQIIKPETKQDNKTAQTDKKDGEKMNIPKGERPIDESQSDGSGGAFEATERVDD